MNVRLGTARNLAIIFRVLSRKYIKLYDGAVELLEKLKASGEKIYLLSNAQSDFTKPEIILLGLDKYLDRIFISSEVGVKKPGKEFYEKLRPLFANNHKIKAKNINETLTHTRYTMG